jgi:hypothetical protein
MTKQEITKIIIIALVGTFTKSLFDNLLGKYIPNKKKLNSYIIKFLIFNLRYTLAAYFLINAFLDTKPIDKYFVFTVSIFTSVIFINLLFDIFSFYYSKFKTSTLKIARILEIQDDTDNKIIDVVKKIESNAFINKTDTIN